MRILVDMDDVLENFTECWVEYLNARYGTVVSITDITEWDMSHAFPTLSREQIYSAEFEDDFWDGFKPVPGAARVLEKLISEGHEIFIVTATSYQNVKAKMDRALFRFYPFLKWEQVVITSCKQMVKGDVLIDDGPHNLVNGEYGKILFSANHNRSVEADSIGAVRAENWDDVYREIQKMTREVS